ncbi:hypothetical protein HNR22_001403 [Micromonospora jinlongensis]|uniref:DUF397 domain-containing protein n=1 Tax=Micromonospora jinlongensis TaxID=1287877 RepID=A0A7Y9WY40_9ACTN|nr:hypothetical protein [Micromonospora jinlongensis]
MADLPPPLAAFIVGEIRRTRGVFGPVAWRAFVTEVARRS